MTHKTLGGGFTYKKAHNGKPQALNCCHIVLGWGTANALNSCFCTKFYGGEETVATNDPCTSVLRSDCRREPRISSTGHRFTLNHRRPALIENKTNCGVPSTCIWLKLRWSRDRTRWTRWLPGLSPSHLSHGEVGKGTVEEIGISCVLTLFTNQ